MMRRLPEVVECFALGGGIDYLVKFVTRDIDHYQAIIDQLNLRRPIYSKTTNYGHFGKNDKDLTWEATNKVEALLKAI